MSTSWTRRAFLRGTGLAVVSGGALLGGCASSVAGTPRPVRAAAGTSTSRPTTTRPRRRDPVTLGVAGATRDQSGEFTGQSIKVAQAVFDALGVDLTVVRVGFDSRLAELGTGKVDLLADLDNSRANCQAAVFSAPDYVSLTALAVRPGNPKGIKTYAEVVATGATVAVMERLPQREDAIRAGVPAGKINALPLPDDMLKAVAGGQADCAAFYDIALRSMIASGTARLDVTGGFTAPGQQVPAFGFAFSKVKPNDELVTGFNAELAKLHRSGEWLRISEPFGFTKDNLPPADLTVEKLCAG